MKHIYTLILLSFLSFYGFAQKPIHAKIIDSVTQQPISFATISTNNNSGVISNTEGDFLLYLNSKSTNNDSLKIRCLGYQTKQFLSSTFNDSIIVLSPKAFELEEVLVSNETYSPIEIIAKIKENLNANYSYGYSKNKLFYRSSNFVKLLKNDVEVNKSSIPELNQQLIDNIIATIPKSSDDYTEILANLYSKPSEDEQKLDIIKASQLYDKTKDLNINTYEDKLNTIIKKHIKRDSYFKIKSGWLGVKSNIDSTSISFGKTKKDIEQTDAMIEEQKKKEAERKANFSKYQKTDISSLQQNSFVFEDSDFTFLEKSNRYDFSLEDYIFLNGEFVYKINFTPKRKEKFKGTIYVNTEDFAIIRIDYENIKDLKRFKLLGLSYTKHLKTGTLIYSKNNENKYSLKYAETTLGNTFGLKRPLTIIEKNKNVKGRRKQNEIDTDIHFIVSTNTKQELVYFETESIDESTFSIFEEQPNIKPVYLPKYDPDFWTGHNVIEPNQAIKDFKSLE